MSDTTSSPVTRQNTFSVNPPPILDIVKISNFHGFSNENGQKYLEEFESYCTFNGLHDDDRRVAAFHLHLKGPALVWFSALDLKVKQTWLGVCSKFKEQYCSVNMFDANMVAESAIFDALCLKPHQALESFYSEVLEKGLRLKKPERDIIAKFVSGLPPQLAFFVRARNITTSRDALQHAKLGEAYGYRTTAVATAVSAPSSESDTIAKLTQRIAELELAQSKTNNVKPSFKRTVCFHCKGEGHIKVQCNWTGTASAQPETSCQMCSQKGHSAKNCKTFPGN